MIIRSKYVIDCTGEFLEDTLLVISEGRISAIEKAGSPSAHSAEYVDLGDCSIIIPGLVNAHTHLELTLAQAHVTPESRFTDWLRNVIRTTSQWTPGQFADSLEEGIRRSISSGTTSVGDISSRGDTLIYSRSPLRARIFYEIIDFNPSSAEQTATAVRQRLAQRPRDRHVSVGISPHTPYTVSEKLLSLCAELARHEDVPVCIHIAETPAERQFLEQGTGEILQFRKEFGLPQEWNPPGKTPVHYIRDLGLLEQPAALVHCNYVNENDLDIIAETGASVVFCPRSHAYFRHTGHPLEQMLERDINVALGTDSLASSPSLDILEEMRTVRSLYPGIAPIDVLNMATRNGLKALALPPDGAHLLQAGCPATLTGITVSPDKMEAAKTPLEALFSGSARAVFSMMEGHILLDSIGSGILQ